MGSLVGLVYTIISTVIVFAFIAAAVGIGVYLGNKWTKNGLPSIFQFLEAKKVNNKKEK